MTALLRRRLIRMENRLLALLGEHYDELPCSYRKHLSAFHLETLDLVVREYRLAKTESTSPAAEPAKED